MALPYGHTSVALIAVRNTASDVAICDWFSDPSWRLGSGCPLPQTIVLADSAPAAWSNPSGCTLFLYPELRRSLRHLLSGTLLPPPKYPRRKDWLEQRRRSGVVASALPDRTRWRLGSSASLPGYTPEPPASKRPRLEKHSSSVGRAVVVASALPADLPGIPSGVSPPWPHI